MDPDIFHALTHRMFIPYVDVAFKNTYRYIMWKKNISQDIMFQLDLILNMLHMHFYILYTVMSVYYIKYQKTFM
jgi:hypothetical protein